MNCLREILDVIRRKRSVLSPDKFGLVVGKDDRLYACIPKSWNRVGDPELLTPNQVYLLACLARHSEDPAFVEEMRDYVRDVVYRMEAEEAA